MGFFSKLFGSTNKPSDSSIIRVMAQMGRLSELAEMATTMIIIEDIGWNQATSDLERETLLNRAGAQANLLFDAPLEYHVPDIERERKEAFAWLERRPIFKELIVQTLRVRNTGMYALTGQSPDPIIGISILEQYGKHFPNEPNPENYNELLVKAVNSLPALSQQKFLSQLKNK